MKNKKEKQDVKETTKIIIVSSQSKPQEKVKKKLIPYESVVDLYFDIYISIYLVPLDWNKNKKKFSMTKNQFRLLIWSILAILKLLTCIYCTARLSSELVIRSPHDFFPTQQLIIYLFMCVGIFISCIIDAVLILSREVLDVLNMLVAQDQIFQEKYLSLDYKGKKYHPCESHLIRFCSKTIIRLSVVVSAIVAGSFGVLTDMDICSRFMIEHAPSMTDSFLKKSVCFSYMSIGCVHMVSGFLGLIQASAIGLISLRFWISNIMNELKLHFTSQSIIIMRREDALPSYKILLLLIGRLNNSIFVNLWPISWLTLLILSLVGSYSTIKLWRFIEPPAFFLFPFLTIVIPTLTMTIIESAASVHEMTSVAIRKFSALEENQGKYMKKVLKSVRPARLQMGSFTYAHRGISLAFISNFIYYTITFIISFGHL